MEAYYTRLDEVEKELAEVRRDPARRRQRPDRRHGQQRPGARPDPAFREADKPIGAECYGVACLAFARDLRGPREHHLRASTSPATARSTTTRTAPASSGVDFNMGPPPYPLEYILRDATAPDGEYIGNVGQETSVIVDYPFITGRSTPDSYLTGEKMVEVLEEGPDAGMAGSSRQSEWRTTRLATEDRALRDPRAAAGRRHRLHVRQPGDRRAGLPGRARQLSRPPLHPDPAGDDRGRHRPTATPGRDTGRRSSSSTAGSGSATASGCSTRPSAAARPLVVIAGESGITLRRDGRPDGGRPGVDRPARSRSGRPGWWTRARCCACCAGRSRSPARAPTGPVFVCLPADVLDAPNTRSRRPDVAAGHAGRPGARRSIAEAATLLAGAERPLIIMGDGISMSGAQAELTRVAELLGAEVWGANSSEVNIDETHPLFRGQPRPHVRPPQRAARRPGRRRADRRHVRLPGGLPGPGGRASRRAPGSSTSTWTPTRSPRTSRSTWASSPTRS